MSDTDETWMHKGHLFNYPGLGSVAGSALVETPRTQVDTYGVERHQGTEVTAVETQDGGFGVTAADDEYAADYVVLATGATRDLAASLGCAFTHADVVDASVTTETSVEDVYATGAMVRAEEWQVVVSAGDGAAAALDILTKEKGEHVHDFVTPADAEALFGASGDVERPSWGAQ